MRLILDTHAYAWWVTDDRKLTRRVRSLLIATDTEVLISSVVPWELATKFRIGKWPGADTILADLDLALVEDRLTPLPITPGAPAFCPRRTRTRSTACWPPRSRPCRS